MFRPDDHELVWAAIGPEAGFVPFRTGTTSAHYGQYVSKRTNATLGLIRFGGHLPKGGYDVPNAQTQHDPAAPAAVL